jgi:hypothetical protein
MGQIALNILFSEWFYVHLVKKSSYTRSEALISLKLPISPLTFSLSYPGEGAREVLFACTMIACGVENLDISK